MKNEKVYTSYIYSWRNEKNSGTVFQSLIQNVVIESAMPFGRVTIISY